jgi:hypothetical protein
MGLQLGYLLGGSILIETVFSWPGTGFLLNSAIFQRDLPLLQGTILVLALFFVVPQPAGRRAADAARPAHRAAEKISATVHRAPASPPSPSNPFQPSARAATGPQRLAAASCATRSPSAAAVMVLLLIRWRDLRALARAGRPVRWRRCSAAAAHRHAGLSAGQRRTGPRHALAPDLGGRLSLFMGITPVHLSPSSSGTVIGIVAGYAGGWVNTVIMRTIDVFYAFPSVLLAIALSGALGAGIVNSLISLTVVFVPQIARVAESVTTQVRNRDYVEAARASGAPARSPSCGCMCSATCSGRSSSTPPA